MYAMFIIAGFAELLRRAGEQNTPTSEKSSYVEENSLTPRCTIRISRVLFDAGHVVNRLQPAASQPK
jgi:hypothetical protein